jgi:hypothetical protein
MILASQSKNVQVTNLMQSLRRICLKREADRQNTNLRSADGPATRSRIAAAATTYVAHCVMKGDYCLSTAHKACNCELLIIHNEAGAVHPGSR